MKRIFIIHGWNSKPTDGWKPWLKKQLEDRGFAVEVPAMPSPLKPNFDKWMERMKQIETDEDTYFVGHSLGCITILKYLESAKAGGTVLVAGFLEDMGYPMIGSFFRMPAQIEKIKKNCGNFTVLHSEDDKWVKIRYAHDLAEKLGAKMIIEKKSGHFTSKEAPAVLDAVLKITG